MKIKYKYFWLSLIILFTALFLPINGKTAGPSFDKLAHLLLFAFVSMNTCFYFLEKKNLLILASVFISTLPFTTEYLQTFIVGRNFEVKDIFADVLGLIVGVAIYFTFKNIIKKIYSLLGEPNA